MATGAADGFFRCVYEGCISGANTGIERRPYHRNCRCALHKSKGYCPHVTPRRKNVSYPMRRAWSEGCLALAAAASCHSSPSSSPVVEVGRAQLDLGIEDDHDFNNSCKV